MILFTLLIQLFVISSVETSIVEIRGPVDGTRLEDDEDDDDEALNTVATFPLPLFSVVDDNVVDNNNSGTFSLPFIL